MEDLRGKVAVVTGGASGIGRALCERFAAEGMGVVVGDIEEGSAKAAADALSAGSGVDAVAVPVDVTDQDSVLALADAARERFGTVHVVCNNAGVAGHFGRTWDTPLADWRWVLDVNVWGVVHGIRAFVPLLVEQNEGHVVNTASLAGWQGVPGMGPYCASKHAVLSISESLRLELEASGINVGVTALCPGVLNTNLMTGARNWPGDRLGDKPGGAPDPVGAAIWEHLRNGVETGPPPSLAADAVVDAVRQNRFLATSHPDELAMAAERRKQVAGGAAPGFGGGAE